MRTNRQKHCSLWLCHTIGVLIHGLTDKVDTVLEFDSDRCFFLLWLPNFRKFCMSKHSCSYAIIVPLNNIQKRLLLSIFLCREGSGEFVHLHMLTWVFVLLLKYHVLAQIMIYVPFIKHWMLWWGCTSNHGTSRQPSVRCINASKNAPSAL